MANQWFRMYAEFATDPKVQMLSEDAHRVADIAHRHAEARRYCYPDWGLPLPVGRTRSKRSAPG